MKLLQTVSACVLALSSLVSAASFTNPLKQKDGSDPHIVFSGGYYYMMTTTWTDLRVTRAATLGGLKDGETRTVFNDTTPSRSYNLWAAELHHLNGAWHIYYTAGAKDTLDQQRLYVLKGGATPFDKFSYHAQLTDEWSIDASIVRFDTWGTYLIWSCFSLNKLQSLCIALLTDPGKIGTPKVLSRPTQSWETQGKPVMEGPAALYHAGKTFLAYSASACWTASYSLGLLTWDGKSDPTLERSWTKTGPIFTSANQNWGPGHNGFFRSPDGTETWNVYHATAIRTGNCAHDRYTMAQKVNWNSNGTPDLGRPERLGTVLAGPSGE